MSTTSKSLLRYLLLLQYLLRGIVLGVCNTPVRLFFLCAFLVLFGGCNRGDTGHNGKVAVHVQVTKVIKKDVPIFIYSFGTLKESKNVDIKSQISGQINGVYFKDGEHVKKGELLFSIEPESYRATLKNDLATLEEDKADLKLKQYFVDKNRNIALHGALPQQNYEKMLTDRAVATAKIKVDQAHIELDKINLKHCSIYSPIDGIIGINNIDAGNIVTTNDILANVKSITPLHLAFTLPERDISRLEKDISSGNIEVMIYVKKMNNDGKVRQSKYPGNIKFLNNTADSSTGTISLQAIVQNKTGNLLPGEFAKIKIKAGEKKNAVLIPKAAAQTGAGGQFIYVVRKDVARRINITASQSMEKYYILQKGKVKPGDKAIVTGLETIYDGMRVKENFGLVPKSASPPAGA